MWEKERGFCENCVHHRPDIDDCIECYVEKLRNKSFEFLNKGERAHSEKAVQLMNYLQKLR